MSINCRRLLQPNAARDILLWTAILTVGLTVGSLLLGGLIPEEMRLVKAMLVGLQVFVMYFLAARLQGRAITLHLEQGGEMASYWSVVVIGIVCGIILLWTLVALGLMPAPGTMLEPNSSPVLL